MTMAMRARRTSTTFVFAWVAMCAATGCFEASGNGAIAGAGGASAGTTATGGTNGAGTGVTGGTGGGTGTGGAVAGTGTGGGGSICDDCCAGIPNPSCAVVDCACPPTGGASGTGGSGGAGGMGGVGGTGAGTGGTTCDATKCLGFDCCGTDTCVNLQNDINNCGTCGNVCTGGDGAYCDNGKCGTAPCDAGMACLTGTCCGAQCCGAGELCCSIDGPVLVMTTCTKPTDLGTCPMGCRLCACNSPDTPIATPGGTRAIASLREGDLVYSVEDGATVAVPLALVVRNPVSHHEVVRVTLDDGTQVEISARHPLVDGRTIGDLRAGSEVEGAHVRVVETVPYPHAFTYDILPASRTGAYYAGGVLVRSTLSP